MSETNSRRANGSTDDEQNAQKAAPFPAHFGQNIPEGVLRELTQSDLELDSKRLLAKLLSKAFVLGNFDDARMNERIWHVRIVKELFIAMHPDRSCLITGEDRAAINDDPHDTLRPLAEEDMIEVENIFAAIEARLTRGKDMKQQELLRTQIAERRDNTSDDDGGSGLLGKLRRS